jgi:hypothetical protein
MCMNQETLISRTPTNDFYSVGSCDNGNEPLVSMKYWEILELPHSWRLLKKC